MRMYNKGLRHEYMCYTPHGILRLYTVIHSTVKPSRTIVIPSISTVHTSCIQLCTPDFKSVVLAPSAHAHFTSSRDNPVAGE